MPTYAYACTECGHHFEIQQSFTDDSLTVCPECSGRLRKLFNAVGVVFKGSGFYRTDSRSGTEKSGQDKSSSANGASSPGSSQSSSSSKSSGSSESSKSSGSANTSSSPSSSASSSAGSTG